MDNQKDVVFNKLNMSVANTLSISHGESYS